MLASNINQSPTSASSIDFIPVDKAPTNPTGIQWRIRSVDPVNKKIGEFDVSRHSFGANTNTNINTNSNANTLSKSGEQQIVLESVAMPGHVIAIKSKSNMTHNRWVNGSRLNNGELANIRPADINIDGVYPEWQLLPNVKRAGDMSIFILESAA